MEASVVEVVNDQPTGVVEVVCYDSPPNRWPFDHWPSEDLHCELSPKHAHGTDHIAHFNGLEYRWSK